MTRSSATVIRLCAGKARVMFALAAVLLLSGFSLEKAQRKLPGLTIESQGQFTADAETITAKSPIIHLAKAPAADQFSVAFAGLARSQPDDPQDFDWVLEPAPRQLVTGAPGRFFLVRPDGSRTLELWAMDEKFRAASLVAATPYTYMQPLAVRGVLVAAGPSPERRGFRVDVISSVTGEVLTVLDSVMPGAGGQLFQPFGADYLQVLLFDRSIGLIALHRSGTGKDSWVLNAQAVGLGWRSLHEQDGLRYGVRVRDGEFQLDVFRGSEPLLVDDGAIVRLARLKTGRKGAGIPTLAQQVGSDPVLTHGTVDGRPLGWAALVARGDGTRQWHFLDIVNGLPQLDPLPWLDLQYQAVTDFNGRLLQEYWTVQRHAQQWTMLPLTSTAQGHTRGAARDEFAGGYPGEVYTNSINAHNAKVRQQLDEIRERQQAFRAAMDSGDGARARMLGKQMSARAFIEAVLKYGVGSEAERATARAWARDIGGDTYAQVIDKLGTSDYLEAQRAANAALDPAVKKRLAAREAALKDGYLRALNPHLYQQPATTAGSSGTSSSWGSVSTSSWYDPRSNRGTYNDRYSSSGAGWTSYQNSVQRNYDNKAYWENYNRRR